VEITGPVLAETRLAGTALTFGMWWIYFILPCGPILERHRERSFGWGYGHIVLFGALVAVGAGLHVAAYYVEHHSVLDTTGTVLAVAVPVSLYIASVYVLHYQLGRVFDPFHLLLLGGTALVVAGSITMAATGAPMVWGLALLSLAPWVTVVGYETVGYRHGERVLDRL
jgi:low temperature requirement protein LtrA